MNLREQEALFLMVNGVSMLKSDTILADVMKDHKDPDDGFLYILYDTETVFGNNS